MKNLRQMKYILIIVLLTLGSKSWAGVNDFVGKVDYNNGFCVPQELEITADNAVVRVTKESLSSEEQTLPLLQKPEDHHFFDKDFGVAEIYSFNWSGSISLNKITEQGDGIIRANFNEYPGKVGFKEQVVKCVADFEVTKTGRAYPPWAGNMYRENAEFLVEEAAKSVCSQFNAIFVRVADFEYVDHFMNDTFKSFATATASFYCQ